MGSTIFKIYPNISDIDDDLVIQMSSETFCVIKDNLPILQAIYRFNASLWAIEGCTSVILPNISITSWCVWKKVLMSGKFKVCTDDIVEYDIDLLIDTVEKLGPMTLENRGAITNSDSRIFLDCSGYCMSISSIDFIDED